MSFPIKRLLSFMPGGILVAFSEVEITDESENKLTLNSDGWPIVFDRTSKVISHSENAVGTFSEVETVEIAHFVNGKRFEWWVLSIRLRGVKKLRIGRSTDGAQLSTVAVHIATITGKGVRIVERVGL